MPNWTSDCDEAVRNRVTSAFEGFINNAALVSLSNLQRQMNAKWSTILIDCGNNDDPDDRECRNLDGAWNGTRLLICDTHPPRVGPILLHEMVHACRGEELDSEAVEHAVFNGSGATLPFGSDWRKFRSETTALGGNEKERVARYVIWNSDTGEVWVKVERDGAISKGTRIFQSDGWKHSYS